MGIRNLFAAVISAAMCLQLTSVRVLSESNLPTESQPPVVKTTETPQPTTQPQTPAPTKVPLVDPSSQPTEAPALSESNSTQEEQPEVKPQVRSIRASNLDLNNQTLEINSKEDFLVLFNNPIELHVAENNDGWRYGISGKIINLNTDIVVSSDEINAQFSDNTLYKNYEHSFQLFDSDFHGHNHTITITQGTRNIYPLFGRIVNDSGKAKVIDELKVVYKGDVHGSGFAQDIANVSDQKLLKLNDITILVEGDILPAVSIESYVGKSINQKTVAIGFSETIKNAEIKNISLEVTGNIGSKKQPYLVDTINIDQLPDLRTIRNVVKSYACGFVLRNTSSANDGTFTDISDINIKVGGSVIAHGINCPANSCLFGYTLDEFKLENINLYLKGDVIAETERTTDNNLLSTLNYSGGMSSASGFAYNLHYLNGAKITIDGNIIYDNQANLATDIAATGICYSRPNEGKFLSLFPRTISNVQLIVNKDIKAIGPMNTDYIGNSNDLEAYAIAGAGYIQDIDSDTKAGLAQFNSNKITVHGKVMTKSEQCQGIVCAWGELIGSNNKFFINDLTVETTKGAKGYVSPIYGAVKTEKTEIIVNTINSKTNGNGYIAGFAYYTASAKDSNITIGNINSEGAKYLAGYTTQAYNYSGISDIQTGISNEHLEISNIVAKAPKKNLYLGGLIATDFGVNVDNSSLNITKISVQSKKNSNDNNNYNNNVYFGGFAAFSSMQSKFDTCQANIGDIAVDVMGNTDDSYYGGFAGKTTENVEINNSKAHIKSINVLDPGQVRAGGFVGWAINTNISNSATLVDKDISVNDANNPNVGGFGGCIENSSVENSAAQIGGSIDLNKSQGEAYAGGFIGHMYGSTINKCTALTFGNLKANVDKETGLSAFIGIMDYDSETSANKNTVDLSAAYLGGNIEWLNKEKDKENNKDKELFRSGLCSVVKDANVKNFTLLVNKNPIREQLKKTEYIGKIDENHGSLSFEPIYLVETQKGTRTAYLANLDDPKKPTFGKKSIGEIEIAVRSFQDKFWGKNAQTTFEKDTYVPDKFDYVRKHDGVSSLEFYTPDAQSLLTNDGELGEKLETKAFTTRHLSTMSDGITYDILGIKELMVITYDPNGATSGKVPVDDNFYDTDDIATVLGNTGNLAMTGYEFAGWNTKADGTGKAYKQGDQITMVESLVLYAQWTPSGGGTSTPSSRILVRFLGEGGFPVVQEKWINPGDKVSRTEVVDPIRAGYVFDGWYYYDKDEWKLSKPQGADHLKPFSFDQRIYASIDIYAKWKKQAVVVPVVDDKKHVPPTSDGDACLFELP